MYVDMNRTCLYHEIYASQKLLAFELVQLALRPSFIAEIRVLVQLPQVVGDVGHVPGKVIPAS